MAILKLKNTNFTVIRLLFLGDVDIEKVLVSNKISFGEKTLLALLMEVLYWLLLQW